MKVCVYFVFERYGDNLDLHGLTLSFPTRRSSDLSCPGRTKVRCTQILRPVRPTEERRGYCASRVPARSINPASSSGAASISSAPNMPASRSAPRSEEHTSELQSLMRISYAVFFLKTKRQKEIQHTHMLQPHQYSDYY